jgi:radical SAM superfamily enzyme YgiQ (UPF0313 family)
VLTLINTNMMQPAIGPVGLDYIAGAAKSSGIKTELVDLCLEEDYEQALKKYFSSKSPSLIGLSFRNVDDCFWPSAEWFVPKLGKITDSIRELSDAPIVVGGVGFSIFGKEIIESTGADFGVAGDGEQTIMELYNQLHNGKGFKSIKGLIWRRGDEIICNGKSWPEKLSLAVERDVVNNREYFRRGGQCGFETKRGCNRGCIYCADPLAKGPVVRVRQPSEIADEVQNLLNQGIDVLHTCDSEFNIPVEHAFAVCEELIRRGLGNKVQWYTYMTVRPFDSALAQVCKQAGCVGIDFTTDSACPSMLKTYRQTHIKADIETAVRLCRDNGIKVMLDLLLGGPGESPASVAESIEFFKRLEADCFGASLGVRIYPGTGMASVVAAEGDIETNPNLKRKYDGPVNFFKPTFYISSSLGDRPAQLVRDLIDGDKRFFEPMVEIEKNAQGKSTDSSFVVELRRMDHNYNDNTELLEAIKKGARGAYWDILHQLRA